MDNEYLDLPDDPDEAFATLHRRKFSELEAGWEENDGNGDYWGAARDYVDTMIVWDEVYNLSNLEYFKSVPATVSEFADFFQVFRRHVEKFQKRF